jgi:hypothetical protein
MADLTDEDVSEMQRFLTAACADLKRWLPEPEWRPGWQSEAAGERANQESGPNGPWGPDPVRSVYVAAALYLELVLQSLRALAASLTTDSTHYVPNCLARAATEAGSQAFWLLEPGIGARRRVARFMLIRASGARYRAEQVRLTDPKGAGSYGETPELAADFAASLGLSCTTGPKVNTEANGGARTRSYRATPNATACWKMRCSRLLRTRSTLAPSMPSGTRLSATGNR